MKRSPAKPVPEELKLTAWDRCFSRIDFTGGRDGCWIWTGRVKYSGYPVIRFRGKDYSVQRVLMATAGIEPSPTEVSRHKCDNALCVNVRHLEPGTHKQNIQDMYLRNRAMIGERHYAAKLCDKAIRAIRLSDASNADVARKHCVSPTTIHDIRNRKTWKHI